MRPYKCEYCNFSSNLLGNYKQHLKTRKHNRNINQSVIPMVMSQNEPKMSHHGPNLTLYNSSNKLFNCEYCYLKYTTLANKRKHELHRCKKSPEVINYKLKNKDNEINNLKKQIELLITKVGNTTNNTTINNNIQLNNYGNEDMTHITDNLKSHMLQIPYGMIPKMIEAVHFNEKKPENKNIVLTNKKENKLKVFCGNKWIYKNKEEVLTNLIDGKYYILDSHYDSLCKMNNLKDVNKDKYDKFRDKYDNKDKNLHDDLRSKCELILLNNR